MSDDEIENSWKPNGRRPQSTMAQSFSAALDDMFKMDNSIADLDAAVAEKKHAVVSHVDELEALEARLRATEERLKANGLAVAPRSPKERMALESLLQRPETRDGQVPTSPSAQQNKQASRPTTATRPGTGKAKEDSYANQARLPPTPGASEGEYVEVPRTEIQIADYIVLNKDGQETDDDENEEDEESEEEVPPPKPSRTRSRRLRASQQST